MALSDKEMMGHDGEGPKHIMLSYQARVHPSRILSARLRLTVAVSSPQWDSQAMILRIHITVREWSQ